MLLWSHYSLSSTFSSESITPHPTLAQAFLEIITAFHGGVILEQFTLDTPQIWATAFEVVTGLVIEGVFIAMLVQRFFGK